MWLLHVNIPACHHLVQHLSCYSLWKRPRAQRSSHRHETLSGSRSCPHSSKLEISWSREESMRILRHFATFHVCRPVTKPTQSCCRPVSQHRLLQNLLEKAPASCPCVAWPPASYALAWGDMLLPLAAIVLLYVCEASCHACPGAEKRVALKAYLARPSTWACLGYVLTLAPGITPPLHAKL